MSRKAILLTLVLLVLVGGAGTVLALLLRHEARWVLACEIPPGKERLLQSAQCQSAMFNLVDSFKAGPSSGQQGFDAEFTAREINSYFQEHFVTSGLAALVLPHGMSQPRVAIEPDKIRLAFRYGHGPWSTLISIDMRVWLASREHNIVALELQGLWAGALPISVQSLLERVSDTVRQQNIEVTWYRHEGNPVALLRFQSQPTIHLQRLEVRDGAIRIHGSSAGLAASMSPPEPGSLQAMLRMADLIPAAD
jgi:hypothetical protein